MAEWVTPELTKDGLRVRLEWLDSVGARTAAEHTRGKLWIWLGNELVWGKQVGSECIPFEWTWIELLEFLSENWSSLEWEESYPINVQPRWPSLLRAIAENRWAEMPEERALEEESELFAFEHRHDLAKGLQGVIAQSLWLLREGDLMWVASKKTARLLRADGVISLLERFGDAIRNRLHSCSDARAQAATQNWSERRSLPYWEKAEIATGMSRDDLESLPTIAQHQPPPNAAFEMTEFFALARLMAGSLGKADIEKVFAAVSSVGHQETPSLDQLSNQAIQMVMGDGVRKPYEEGYALASWLRAHASVQPGESTNPAAWLEKYRVTVREFDISDERLDAFACWGPKHGPVVFLNKQGKHAQTEPGRNATLAHEFCHLLLDREGSLPLAEVLNGRAPLGVEQRAKAFAAELLLPRAVAKAAAIDGPNLQETIHRLRSDFGVSWELVINQIINAGVPPELKEELERQRSLAN